MKLHVQRYGQGPPLLILHGLFGALDNWHPLSLKFAKDFQVLAVDQRNHGRSPHNPEMSYPLMAADLKELVETAGLERVCLIGHSMGGKTAMQFALSYPEKTEKLVVEDIAPKLYAPRHLKIFSALLGLELARFQSRREIEDALAVDIPDLALRRFLLKNLERTSAAGFRWRIGLAELRQNNDRLREAPASGQPFSGPALFIRGERSDYLVPEDLPGIRGWFPRAELLSIPGAGHIVHADQPEAFFRAAIEFLGGDGDGRSNR